MCWQVGQIVYMSKNSISSLIGRLSQQNVRQIYVQANVFTNETREERRPLSRFSETKKLLICTSTKTYPTCQTERSRPNLRLPTSLETEHSALTCLPVGDELGQGFLPVFEPSAIKHLSFQRRIRRPIDAGNENKLAGLGPKVQDGTT